MIHCPKKNSLAVLTLACWAGVFLNRNLSLTKQEETVARMVKSAFPSNCPGQAEKSLPTAGGCAEGTTEGPNHSSALEPQRQSEQSTQELYLAAAAEREQIRSARARTTVRV